MNINKKKGLGSRLEVLYKRPPVTEMFLGRGVDRRFFTDHDSGMKEGLIEDFSFSIPKIGCCHN